MGVTEFTTLITNVGFPISCVIFMGIFIYQFSNKVIQYNREREDKLYEIIKKSQDQLDKLEESFEDYVTVLGKLRDDVNEIRHSLDIRGDDGK